MRVVRVREVDRWVSDDVLEDLGKWSDLDLGGDVSTYIYLEFPM